MSRRGFRGGKRSGIGSRGSESRKRAKGDIGDGDGGLMIDDGHGVFHCIAHSWEPTLHSALRVDGFRYCHAHHVLIGTVTQQPW